MTEKSVGPAIGTCAVVLHSHLPWLPHHGAWPVGEEWLHQAWSGAYLPLAGVLRRLAAEGRRDLLTLGVTPVLAAQLDDAYCLREFHTWLGFWLVRAEGMAARREPHLRRLAGYEHRLATAALAEFEGRWRHGAAPVLRELADAGVVELASGPATHPFLPLLDERVARFALSVGLDDAAVRYGTRPGTVWSPECGHRPGLERVHAAAGVRRVVLDGPSVEVGGGSADGAWTLGDSDVAVLARDRDLSGRVWSPASGYPGRADYRDFPAVDTPSGFRTSRVTSRALSSQDKEPYDPQAAAAAAEEDARDFVAAVRGRLAGLAAERGRPGLVVVAWDTELFGHWWHEGPVFLERMLRLLPEAGVRLATLAGAVAECGVAGRVDPAPGSWDASGFGVWDGPQDLADAAARVQRRLLDVVPAAVAAGPRERRPDLDQLAREALLVLASDWAFMASHDRAARYARDRAGAHELRFRRLADTVGSGRDARREAAELAVTDGLLAALDARLL